MYNDQRATRRQIVGNVLLMFLALLFIGALAAYVFLARSP